jgi:hypothetical protein
VVAFDVQFATSTHWTTSNNYSNPLLYPAKGVHGVFPTDGVLQLCGSSGRGGVFLFVIDRDTLPSTQAFRFQPP